MRLTLWTQHDATSTVRGDNMIRTEWRLDMKLKDAKVLHQFMEYKGLNIRQLADRSGVSRATIGHLHSGARNTTSAKTAAQIEKALDCPAGFLFEATVSKVSREVAA